MTRPFTHRHDDGGEGIVQQDHCSGLSCDVGASQPHGNADISLAQRRCIVDAIPGHGDDFPSRLVGAHEPELFLRTHAGKDVGAQQCLVIGRHKSRQIGPFDGTRHSAPQSHGTANAARRHRVIAGDHDHSDPRFPAGSYGLRHVGARRVRETDETQEGQILEWPAVGRRAVAHGASQHPQALASELLHAIETFGVLGLIHGDAAILG